jgi:delta24(24(1))-sterol reductase
MSGNFFYDLFMGAPLNPRIFGIDLKMWVEIRIPWVLLFLFTLSACLDQVRFVAMAFFILFWTHFCI